MLYDITPPVSPALQVFPGDTPPSREVLLDIAHGDHITLSTLRTTVHLGAHLDAPSHYGPDGAAIEDFPLDRALGTCQVIDVSRLVTPSADGNRVAPGDWVEQVTEERVLLATGSYPDPHHWNEDFAGIAPPLVETLAERGVTLIGIDTPSVDPSTSKELPAHQSFFRTGISILEGIVLADVPQGRYELIALPLKLVGFDASPVRAVLRAIEPGSGVGRGLS